MANIDVKQAVDKWISEKGLKCVACGGSLDGKPQVTISLPVVGGRVVTAEDAVRLGLGPGLPGLPLASAVCHDCGFVMQFAAIKIGAAEKANS